MSDASRLEETIARLALENSQLRQALESRVVIEQAKGVLAERYKIDVDEAFDLLRDTARAERVALGDLARLIGAKRAIPRPLARALARRGDVVAIEPRHDPENAT